MRIVGRALQMYGPGYHHDHVNHPWLWLVAMLMVVAAIGVLTWALVRGSRPAYHGPAPGAVSDPAVETLRMRFARGEIESDEYATRSAQLSGVLPPVTPAPGPPAS
jgi:uncharacterized membrane protein